MAMLSCSNKVKENPAESLQAWPPVQTSHCIGRVQKWWQKVNQHNMREIASAQDLQESLLKAGDKLVVVDFFLPGPWLSRLQSFPSEGSTEVPMVVYATSAAMLPLSRNLEMRLARYNTEKFSVGTAKGLEESELIALAASRDISFNYVTSN